MKKLLLLTTYDRNSPSSRMRHIRFIDYLSEQGFLVVHQSFFKYSTLESRYHGKNLRVTVVMRSYYERMKILFKLRNFDVIWIEKEMIPYSPRWVEKLLFLNFRGKVVIDFDDDLFSKYRTQIPRLLRMTFGKYSIIDLVNITYTTSSKNMFRKINQQAEKSTAELLPYYLDLERYPKKSKIHKNKRAEDLVVGWIGNPFTSISQLGTNLEILKSISNIVSVSLMGASETFSEIPNVQVIEWSEDTEVAFLSSVDIAIMPLPNNEFTEGKSGLKAVQFMACGVPVIASPYSNSIELLTQGRGVIAESPDEWISNLNLLISDPDRRNIMGEKSAKWIKANYDIRKFQANLLEILDK